MTDSTWDGAWENRKKNSVSGADREPGATETTAKTNGSGDQAHLMTGSVFVIFADGKMDGYGAEYGNLILTLSSDVIKWKA